MEDFINRLSRLSISKIIALLLSVLLFGFFITYVPELRLENLHPKYNFLIVTSDDNINPFYFDEDNRLAVIPMFTSKTAEEMKQKVKFEIYDVSEYKKIPISYEQVMKLNLYHAYDSPDGFYVDITIGNFRGRDITGITNANFWLKNVNHSFAKRFLFRSLEGTEILGWIID